MIRFFVYGPPVALVVLVVAAFVNVLSLSASRKNELSVGMLGEPRTLNPIKSADASAGTVQAAIFNGLLKYSAELEIVGDLAESFELDQETTVFFADENAALTGLLALEFERARWPGWGLEGARIGDGGTLVLRLGEPGMEISRQIAELFPADLAWPVQVVKVAFEGEPGVGVEKLKASVGGGRLVRLWPISGNEFEVLVPGRPEEALEAVKRFFPEGGVAVEIEEEMPFLAEPRALFRLREGVKWHDGAPFTSQDPAFTYRAIMDDAVASPRKPDFETILRVGTPSELEFEVVYKRPFSPALTSWMISILPSHLLEGKPQEWWVKHFDRSPVGTGPFRFGIWRTNEFLRVVRNPDYFDAPGPWLEGISYRILADQLALRLAFETRQVDFWGVDPWAVSGFEKDKRFQLFSQPSNSYAYVGWNLRRPPFDDEKVRIALAHAVNVPEMVEYLLYGHGTQSTGIFTPQMWFFNPEVRPIPYDKARARKMLAEAGWVAGPDGILAKDGRRFTFNLITNSGNEVRRDIATLIQDDFRSIGVEVSIETYEWAVFLRNFVNKGDFDAMVLGWQLGLDFDQFQIWHSSQTQPEQLNVVGYNNPRVDRLLEEVRQTFARPEIIRLAGEIQQIIYDDQPYLFLYVPESTTVLWRDSFRIRRPGPDGGWLDTPVEMTKAGWSYYLDWFYRPDFPPPPDSNPPT